MLIKVSTTEDFVSDVEPVSIITDSKQITKRAGSERFKDVKVPKHQTAVHIIALGSTEGTGVNRNSDRFDEDDCIKCHHTFVKAGRAIHHNHKNKPSDPKYGDIYASDYNQPMRRIELLIGVDNDKPENIEVLNKLSKGEQVCTSMAAKIDHDRCSICDFKAKTQDKRCVHIPSQLGEITKEGKVVSMINPMPTWFEQSFVRRPADRIAYSLNKKAEHLEKSAQERYSDNLVIAKEIYLPPSMTLSKFASSKRELVNKLAKMEKRIDAVAQGKVENSKDKYIKEEASKLKHSPQLSNKTIEELKKFDPKQLFKALTDKGIILSPDEFFDYATDDKVDKKHLSGMHTHLSDIFNNLKDDDIHDEEFQPEENKSLPSSLLNLVKGLVEGHSLANPHAVGRITRITIIGIPKEKLQLKKESSVKSNDYFDQALAVKYASYKLSCLNYLHENDKLDEELMINALLQNR